MAADNILNHLNDRDRRQIFGRSLRSQEIRLVELLPSFDGISRRINCRMTPSLVQARPYIAISYCWGSTANPLTIDVNNTPYKVTKQVVDILSLLAPPQNRGNQTNPANRLRRRPMWIDAISINQQDVPEREIQMNMMKSIYENADCTMLYLGQPPGGDIAAKTALDWLASLTTTPVEAFLALPKERQLRHWDHGCWALVVDLLEKSPWWRRRWTVQEAAVSSEVWIVYGSEILAWDVFADAILRCAYMWSNLANQSNFQTQSDAMPSADVSPTLAIAGLRKRLKSGRRPPQLLETLLNFGKCGCMYPEERLFALLGLCGEEERMVNPIELGVGAVRVFKRFVLGYIGLYRRLDILCAAIQIGRLERPLVRVEEDGLWVDPDDTRFAKMSFLPDLPSWVPNFSSYRIQWLLGPDLMTNEEFKPVFAASSGCSFELPDLRAADKTGVLSVTGIEVDRIAAFHPDFPIGDPAQNTNVSPHWWAIWYWTQTGSWVPNVYPSHEARWVAFLRTVTAGGRSGASDRILSDEYVKEWGERFFRGTLLGQLWHDVAGLREGLPALEKDYYLPSWPDAPRDFLPPVACNMLCFHKFIRGASGRIGLAPPRTKIADRIVVVSGCSSPLLLEDVPEAPGRCRLRGEAYMHGFMFGEAVQLWRQGQLKAQTYHLI